MPYSDRMQKGHLYSVFFAPRGLTRLADLGMQIAQQYLSPFDRLIGLVGEAGSGKSVLIKGMFPGLELTNDDGGVNTRPLPLLSAVEDDDTGFYRPHTYHVDIRFESAFVQMHVLASAILEVINTGRRVIVEHFDLIYPHLDRNAHLLIGIGEEVIITRPTLFGPEPQDIADIVFKSIAYRRMVHSAEDVCSFVLRKEWGITENDFIHSDVRHGFIFKFQNKPDIDISVLEAKIATMISEDIPISFMDDYNIMIGEEQVICSFPRNHVQSTGDIVKLVFGKELLKEPITEYYLLVGIVGEWEGEEISDLNKIKIIGG